MQRIKIAILIAIIIFSVLFWGVFYYSENLGIVHVNYLNSLFLVPFLFFLILVGVFLSEGLNAFRVLPRPEVELTKREREIVKLMRAGMKNQEIANTLFVEKSTIKTHINNIYGKLHVKNRKELAKIEIENL